MEARRVIAAVLSGLALVAIAVVLLPSFGPASISISAAWAGRSPDAEILFDVRLPRVLLSLVVGGALAVAGVVCQAILRDALATPYTLGVSSGASLGAVVAISFRLGGIPLAACLGALAAVLLVVALATEGRRLSSFTLLLAGVTLNSMCFALILFLQNVAPFGQSLMIVRWLMGGIDTIDYPSLGWLSLVVLIATVWIAFHARDWNLLAVGEDWAATRGVEAGGLLWKGYLVVSVLTGLVTAFTGPIGFIGLIVPHALRLRCGADHRLLIPLSFLGGAVFLAMCDTAARMVIAPAEIPVGVITALLGGPFFLWLLRSKRRSVWL